MGVIHMDLRLVSPLRRLDGLGESHALARAAAVVQGKVRTVTRQLARHGQNRRDAYAARQQQVLAGRCMQLEMVARLADGDLLAGLQLLVHGRRAAARGRLAQHGNHIAVQLCGVVAQRVLAHQPSGQVHIDVRAGAERRQAAAFQSPQFQAADASRLLLLVRDAHLERGFTLHLGYFSFACALLGQRLRGLRAGLAQALDHAPRTVGAHIHVDIHHGA